MENRGDDLIHTVSQYEFCAVLKTHRKNTVVHNNPGKGDPHHAKLRAPVNVVLAVIKVIFGVGRAAFMPEQTAGVEIETVPLFIKFEIHDPNVYRIS